MSQAEKGQRSEEDPKASGDVSNHEVNPAENPGPRGNPELNPERVERDEEDLGRISAS